MPLSLGCQTRTTTDPSKQEHTQLAHTLADIWLFDWRSGIFGYINYLVEKDRKFILDTLINGT